MEHKKPSEAYIPRLVLAALVVLTLAILLFVQNSIRKSVSGVKQVMGQTIYTEVKQTMCKQGNRLPEQNALDGQNLEEHEERMQSQGFVEER